SCSARSLSLASATLRRAAISSGWSSDSDTTTLTGLPSACLAASHCALDGTLAHAHRVARRRQAAEDHAKIPANLNRGSECARHISLPVARRDRWRHRAASDLIRLRALPL